jgi:hypothetical protein
MVAVSETIDEKTILHAKTVELEYASVTIL